MTDHTTDGVGVAQLASDGESLAFASTLRPSRFLGLSVKIGLLSLITLTLYRFWGKTEVRRRVWRAIRLNDEAFEYTGRGMELFLGFIFALAIGVPLLLFVFGIQFFVGGEAATLLLGILLLLFYVFVFWLWGFGTFTAFRYMASRTTWRGVRFRLGGSAVGYGFMYLGTLVLTALTLGWYAPTAQRQLAEKIWDELRFGNKRVRFRMGLSQRQGVYGPFALGWFLSAAPYILLIALVIAAVTYLGTQSMVYDQLATLSAVEAPPAPEMPNIAFMILGYVVALPLGALVLLIWAPYQAAILRSITAGISIDDATFSLDVKAIPLWWLTVSNLFFVIITLGILLPWAQARTAHFLISRLRSTGTARLDEAQQTREGPKTGEGLADAFGFSLI